MTGRMAAAAVWPGLLLIMLGGAGCGDGEVIPLQPPGGICDRPPDPHWRILSPLGHDRTPAAGVWTGEDAVCVVGSRGLVLYKEAGTLFRREDPGTVRDLKDVAALPDGSLVAVGEAGTVAERKAGRWTVRQLPGTAGDLNRVMAVGDEAWAVGDGGVVVRRGGAGSWQTVTAPTDVRLTGMAARGDTLAVSGDEGVLLLRIRDSWLDLSPGPWSGTSVGEVAWLADGRLVAMADSFYVRGSDGWSVKDMGSFYWWHGCHPARQVGGMIWVFGRGGVVKVDPGGEEWTFDGVTYDDLDCVAARDSTQALVAGDGGMLRWYEYGRERIQDPAGLQNFNFFRFADGTAGIFTRTGLVVNGPRGLDYLLIFPPEVQNVFGYSSSLAGRSPGDFYLAGYNIVLHVRDGRAEEVSPLAGLRPRSLALDARGDLHLATNERFLRWDGTELTTTLVLPEDFGRVKLSGTAGETLVAQGGGKTWYYSDSAWVPLDDLGAIVTGESPSGDLFFLLSSMPLEFKVWRPGVGLMAEGIFNPFPACGTLGLGGGCDDAHGLHIFTDFPSLVFRQEDGPAPGDWNLVAGPLEGEISELMVLPDASLLARIRFDGTLFHYPAPWEH